MKSKITIELSQNNFKRLKKNLSRNLSNCGFDISSSQMEEVLSKSMGFSNYRHAHAENFKTDKFQNPIRFQTEYLGIEGIKSQLVKMRDDGERLFIFNSVNQIGHAEKNNESIVYLKNHIKEISDSFYNNWLKSKNLIISDLMNYLSIDLNFDIRFDLQLWLDTLNKQDLFYGIFISINHSTLFSDILDHLEKSNRIDLLNIFIQRVKDHISKNQELKYKDVFIHGFYTIPIKYIEELLCENDLLTEKYIEFLLLNFDKLNDNDKNEIINIINRMNSNKNVSKKRCFEEILSGEKTEQLINRIVSIKNINDIASYYTLLKEINLSQYIKIDKWEQFCKELKNIILSDMYYLKSIPEVEQYLTLIEEQLSE